MNQIFKKISFKSFLAIFFLFFLYEYGSPLINSFLLSQKFNLPFSEMFQQRKILKHFLRFPIYLTFYIYFFNQIAKGGKTWYIVCQISLISHLIFKPLTILTALYFVTKTSLKFNLMLSLVWIIVVIIFYLFFVFYLKYYWKKVINAHR